MRECPEAPEWRTRRRKRTSSMITTKQRRGGAAVLTYLSYYRDMLRVFFGYISGEAGREGETEGMSG